MKQIRQLQRLSDTDGGFKFFVVLLQVAIGLNSQAELPGQLLLGSSRLHTQSLNAFRSTHFALFLFSRHAMSVISCCATAHSGKFSFFKKALYRGSPCTPSNSGENLRRW